MNERMYNLYSKSIRFSHTFCLSIIKFTYSTSQKIKQENILELKETIIQVEMDYCLTQFYIGDS